MRPTTHAEKRGNRQGHRAMYAFGAKERFRKARAAWTAQCVTLDLSISFMAGYTDVGLTPTVMTTPFWKKR